MSRFAIALSLAVCVLTFAEASFAEDDFSSLSGHDFDSTLPPEFNAAQAMGQASISVSCKGNQAQQVIQGIGNLLKPDGTAFGPVSINTVCPEAAAPVPEETPDCKYVSQGGKFNQKLFENRLKNITSAQSSLACKRAKIEAVKGEIECINEMANSLTSQISSLDSAYTNNIEKQKTDVAQIDEMIKVREDQGARVEQLLNGNQATGKLGILQLRDQTKQLLDSMDNEIADIRERHLGAEKQRQDFEVNKKRVVASTSLQCFKAKAKTGYQCKVNGPPVSAYEYALCRYEQMQYQSRDGTIEQDQLTATKAKAKAQGLESLLSEIFGEAPQSGKIPKDANEWAANAEQTSDLLTMADVESRFGDSIRGYGQVGDFVMASLKNCFKYGARKAENNEMLKAGQYKLQELDRQTSNLVNEHLKKYAHQYNENIRGLTGMNLPISYDGCVKAKPGDQLDCMKKMKTNMSGVFDGSTPNSEMKIMVKASLDPKASFTVNCFGLNGCTTALQNAHTNLDLAKKNLDTTRKKYIQTARASVKNFTNNVVQKLSPASMEITNRMNALKGALASLGVSSANFQIATMEAEQLEPEDESQLYGTPKNLMGLLGGSLKPPMPKTSESFSDIAGSLSEGYKENNEKMQKLADLRAAVEALKNTCIAEDLGKKAEAVDKLVGKITDKCVDVDRFCQDTSLTSLANDVSGITGNGFDAEAFDVLSTNIEGLPCGGAAVGEQGGSINEQVQRACNAYDITINSESVEKGIKDQAKANKEICIRDETRKKEAERKSRSDKAVECTKLYNELDGKIQKLKDAAEKASGSDADSAD